MNELTNAAVRAAGFGDTTTVGGVLSSAYVDHPAIVRLHTHRAARRRLLRHLFIAVAGWATVNGVVHLREDGAGAAVWLPTVRPQHIDAGLLDDVPAADSAEDALQVALTDLGDAVDFSDDAHTTLDALAELLTPKPILQPSESTRDQAFLFAVGVDPDARRAGIGRQLVTAHHATLDRQATAAITVATDRESLDFYADLGYVPHHVDQAGDLSVQWMLRQPAPARPETHR